MKEKPSKTSTTKLPRVVRLDDLDTQVFPRCAHPGEWAVPGSFIFWDQDLPRLSRKPQQAFAQGFLGLDSFGWSTLVVVAQITLTELDQVTRRLAQHLIDFHGAPDLTAALPAAREEIEFAVSLCDHELNTLIAMQRSYENQAIRERFRVVLPATAVNHEHLRLWGVE
ncbi:MAG: hypothetical protein H6970_12050 [Gammaproteobacteria bacterium]|nr:hypothetical protein [Gammaproteobacteria bacterium]MCP5425779.1 hypothetical protein [Gammaproteobacteria bacterium]MCP5458610.1 hypothetical protein [Gammaproteobacteria bacterium]